MGQPMNRLNVRVTDPMFVDPHPEVGKVILRIGEARRGETRTAHLDAGEARTLAYMLLMAVEDLGAKG